HGTCATNLGVRSSQAQRDHAPRVRARALQQQLSAMALGQAPADVQTEAGSGGIPKIDIVDAVELVEDSLFRGLRNSNALIRDPYLRRFTVRTLAVLLRTAASSRHRVA